MLPFSTDQGPVAAALLNCARCPGISRLSRAPLLATHLFRLGSCLKQGIGQLRGHVWLHTHAEAAPEAEVGAGVEAATAAQLCQVGRCDPPVLQHWLRYGPEEALHVCPHACCLEAKLR